MDEHHEPAFGSVIRDRAGRSWQLLTTRWTRTDHPAADSLSWAELWAQYGPLEAAAAAHETGPAPQSLKTSPMIVAVTWNHDGRPQLGRVADWVHTPEGWTAFVITERGHRGGGWTMADQLQPSDHPVSTTYGSWEWGTWQPPTWPAELARFAGAAWNDTEHARATKYRAGT